MQTKVLRDGIYPAMITPFTKDNKIDFDAVGRLVEWYIENGATGVFAACQSSEMYFLSLEERLTLVREVLRVADGRLDVVACGATSENFDEMLKEAVEVSKLGVKAMVLLSNHLASEDEDDAVLIERLKIACDTIKDVDLGLYECPVPYKRLLTPEILKWCADSDRFVFMKDTSCCVEDMAEKLKAIAGSRLKLYNANTETLLDTVRLGASGISGIMCNYHPYLYSAMLNLYRDKGEADGLTQEMQDVLTTLGYTFDGYTTSAKRYLMHDGVLDCDLSRMSLPLTYNLEIQVQHLYRFTKRMEKYYKNRLEG